MDCYLAIVKFNLNPHEINFKDNKKLNSQPLIERSNKAIFYDKIDNIQGFQTNKSKNKLIAI